MDKKGKILIVEDEKDLRDVIVDALEPLELEITQAENGKQGLDLALTQNFDTILSDINMPIMSGLEFLKELRNNGKWTPFVIITAYKEQENTLIALRNGAFDFIEKPFQFEHLLKVTEQAVQLGISMRSIEEDFQKRLENEAQRGGGSIQSNLKLKEAFAKIAMMKLEHVQNNQLHKTKKKAS